MQWQANGTTFRALIVGPPPGRLVVQEHRPTVGWMQAATLTGEELGAALAGWQVGQQMFRRPGPVGQADGAGGE